MPIRRIKESSEGKWGEGRIENAPCTFLYHEPPRYIVNGREESMRNVI